MYNNEINNIMKNHSEKDLENFKNELKVFLGKRSEEYKFKNEIRVIERPSNEIKYVAMCEDKNSFAYGIKIKFQEFIKEFIEKNLQNFVIGKIEAKLKIIKELKQ